MRTDFSLDYDVLTVAKAHKLFLMARLIAGPSDSARPDLNLSLVIDQSGSMAGSKIDYTQQAAQFLVQHLGVRDTLSIVLYNNTVNTLLAPQHIQNKDEVIQRLDQINVSSTTNLSGGWLQGCQHVAQNYSAQQLNRVILMTDGLANRGVTDYSQLVEMTRQKHKEGISTTTMGLGDDFNESLMMAMAEAGGGAFYFIESPEVTPGIFNEELRGLLNTVGQNLQITINPAPEVSAVQQLNAYPKRMQSNATTFLLGDIYADEIKTLVIEMSIPALKQLGERQIATLRFEYDEINDNGTHHHSDEMPVRVNIRPEEAQPLLPKPQVAHSVLLLQAATAREQAIEAADQGNYEQASRVLKAMADQIEESHVNDPTLDEERNALLAQAEEMTQGRPAYNPYQRKTMSTQAYYTRTDRHDATVMLRTRELLRKVREEQAHAPTAPPNRPAPTHLQWRDKSFPLVGDLIRMGRSIHNEIMIDGGGISRFHCQLKREGDTLLLEDVGSTNGTFLHGQLINTPTIIRAGDEVYLCEEKLVFTHEST
ncbi:VWA domain-containing protein [Phototrophicus methaneseepsis]|uniref:VWA domain-containing protein n=1 Tax=Phototrophicus methaneseepsis TaxID=2710758 RepID=A0A7S8EDE3_9CHLR|nr:VWA domain-containing protein [Phototrophicus methaneseepsis]QPC84894.1 VWA domain-containing protein [Phototrophicus methaneseepsis]